MKVCKKCQGARLTKYGSARRGQRYRCADCSKVFSENTPGRPKVVVKQKNTGGSPALATFRSIAELVLARDRNMRVNKDLFNLKTMF